MSQIGRYEIVRKTGFHGVAAVYDAFDSKMQRPVTIRVAEGDGREEILSDAHALAQLDHPHIVKVLSCEEVDGAPVLVLEQFEGRPLSAILAERAALTAEEATAVLRDAGAALDYAHAKGFVYRNLSTRSLLLDEEGLMKIGGFERSRPERQLKQGQSEEDLADLFESIGYMSPELIAGDPVDGRSDQFSLAAIAFRALTGVPLCQADSPIELMRQIVFEHPSIRDLLGPQHGPALAPVFEKALAKSPSARYSSCTDFTSAFEGALSGKSAAMTRVATLSELQVPSEPSREPAGDAGLHLNELSDRLAAGPRSLTPYIIATAAVVIAAIIAALFLLRPSAPKPTVTTAPAVSPAPVVQTPAPIPAPPSPAKKAKAATPRPPAKKKVEETVKEDKNTEPDIQPIRPKVKLADEK